MGTTKSYADHRSVTTTWGDLSFTFSEEQISFERPHLYEVDAIFAFLKGDNGTAIFNGNKYAVFDSLRWLPGGIVSREECAYSACCKHSHLGIGVDSEGKRLPLPILGTKISQKGNVTPDGEWEVYSSPLKRTPIKVGDDKYILRIEEVQYLRVKASVPYFVPNYSNGSCLVKQIDGEEIAVLKRAYKPVWEIVPDNEVPTELKEAVAAITVRATNEIVDVEAEEVVA
jgi:hypothetical protein